MVRGKTKRRCYYTVYDKHENIVGFGYDEDCAAMLGITLSSFKSMLTRTKTGKNKKYVVVRDYMGKKVET